jgi:hypothetical protein
MAEVLMTSGRDEATVVGLAPIPLVLGGIRKDLPPLVINDNAVWTRHLGERLGSEIDGLDRISSWEQIAGVVVGLTDVMLDLLIEYDLRGVLGGREWIRGHATDGEVYDAFRAVCLVAFPTLREAKSFPGLTGLVVTYLQGRLTSSSSPSGGSTRQPSMAAGPMSSGSSTRSSSPPGGGSGHEPTPIASSRRSPRESRSR